MCFQIIHNLDKSLVKKGDKQVPHTHLPSTRLNSRLCNPCVLHLYGRVPGAKGLVASTTQSLSPVSVFPSSRSSLSPRCTHICTSSFTVLYSNILFDFTPFYSNIFLLLIIICHQFGYHICTSLLRTQMY